MEMAQEIIMLNEVCFAYPEAENPALKHISCIVRQGGFLLLTGFSGCGKTTLLRMLKPTLTPYGTKTGEISYKRQKIENIKKECLVREIGFVMQNPDSQLVTRTVREELYFGLENLGIDPAEIRLRVAEMTSYFGITSWFHKETAKLSGGQKQILNLAAVMTMNPEVLILDEPTSQLDPVSARNFIQFVRQIHEDFGTTILMSEHRLTEVLPLCTEVLLMEKGEILYQGKPQEIGTFLKQTSHAMLAAMPVTVRAAIHFNEEKTPLTVQEGRAWFARHMCNEDKEENKKKPFETNQPDKKCQKAVGSTVEPAIKGKELCFCYQRRDVPVLNHLSVEIPQGKITALVGANGSGKSTLLSVFAGLEKPDYGKVKLFGKAALLPQNLKYLFTENTVNEELAGIPEETIRMYHLEQLKERHPFDLSGGEMARLALAVISHVNPDIYLLDEPTKGMDAVFKEEFSQICKHLVDCGKTIVIVTHDLEFLAEVSDEVRMIFDGEIVFAGKTELFFGENQFYTTMAARMTKGYVKGAVTYGDVVELCQ